MKRKEVVAALMVVISLATLAACSVEEDLPQLPAQLPEGFIRQELPSHGFSIAYPEQWVAADSDTRSSIQDITAELWESGGFEGSVDLVLVAWVPSDPSHRFNVFQRPRWTKSATDVKKAMHAFWNKNVPSYSLINSGIRTLGSKEVILHDYQVDASAMNQGRSGVLRIIGLYESSGLEISCSPTYVENGKLFSSKRRARTCWDIMDSFAYIN